MSPAANPAPFMDNDMVLCPVCNEDEPECKCRSCLSCGELTFHENLDGARHCPDCSEGEDPADRKYRQRIDDELTREP